MTNKCTDDTCFCFVYCPCKDEPEICDEWVEKNTMNIKTITGLAVATAHQTIAMMMF